MTQLYYFGSKKNLNIIRIKIWEFFVFLGNLGKKYTGDFIAALIVAFFTSLAGWLFGRDILSYDMLLSVGVTILTFFILFLMWTPVYTRLTKEFMKARFSPPITVGLLSGYVKDTNEVPLSPAWSEWPVNKWRDGLIAKGFRVEDMVSMQLGESERKKFAIIVNPFGEIYPEEDFPNITTLRNIKNYVKEGGVFVNVAGLAFFYKRDTREGTRTTGLTGQLVESYQIIPIPNTNRMIAVPSIDPRSASLLETWLFRNFGIRTNLFEPPEGKQPIDVYPVENEYFRQLADVGQQRKVLEFRSALQCESEESKFIPLLKAYIDLPPIPGEIKPRQSLCYPIAAVQHGVGYLVLVGMHLTINRPSDFDKVIMTIQKIYEALRDKGSLGS